MGEAAAHVRGEWVDLHTRTRLDIMVHSMNEHEELFTVAEAAKMLGINPKTLRRWDTVGIAHALRTPTNHRRFTLAEIERLMPKKIPQPSEA